MHRQFKDPYEKSFHEVVVLWLHPLRRVPENIYKTLFEMRSSQTNRNDGTLYSIFPYLCFFRLNNLPIQDFRKLIQSQEATKVHVFMQFAYNADFLCEHIRERWLAVLTLFTSMTRSSEVSKKTCLLCQKSCVLLKKELMVKLVKHN